jgi:Fe-S cluster assembly protein SufD
LVRRSAVREAALPFSEDDVQALSERLDEPDWLREARLAAWAECEALPMPTLGDEAWRRTDIRGLRWEERGTLAAPKAAKLDNVPAELRAPLIGDVQGGLIVHVDGMLVHAEINDELAGQGVIFADLSTAAREHADLLRKHLHKQPPPPDSEKLASAHAALWTHGVFLYVPRGVQLELPLHSIDYAPGDDTTLSHILVVLEDGASATYLHEMASPTHDDGQVLHVGATELFVGDGANLNYVALQNWGDHVYDFTTQRASVGRDGQLDWIVGTLGTRLTKAFIDLDLDGQGAWGRMSGLYFTHDRQHLDLDTQQNHNAPDTTSDLLFKGALRDDSRSVWQGMILVQPGAQKTDGFQANRNLVLDNSARADSIPGLEIEADDVRCTHAATVGRMDDEQMFYLHTRGLPKEDAVRLIVNGFFQPIMERIPFEGVRERLQASIDANIAAL